MRQRQYRSDLLLIGLAYLGFISIGLPDGLLGVAWPSIRTFFGLPLDALGALLVMFTAGYVLSSFSSGWVLSRLNVGSLLALSCLATAMSLFGYALTPMWWIMVAFGALAGLGAGAIDAGINTYAATHYSTRMVNWLHACYGIGAASGPIIMTSVLSANLQWQWGYGIVALGQLALAVCFAVTHKQWPTSPATPDTRETIPHHTASSMSTLRLPAMWLSIAAFFIYTGLEAAVGAWAYSLFTEARMIPMETAGLWVSLYWGSLTAGRLVFGLAAGFASVHLLLYFCMVSIAVGTALLWLNLTSTLSFLGLALTGLAAGPIFPSLIATTPARLGKAHTANGVGFEIAAAALGQSLLPALIGMFANHCGLEMIGPALFGAAIILLAAYTILSATPVERVYMESPIPDDA
jgi:fucose permease